MLLKLTVTFAPAGTVIVFVSKAMFCATRSTVIFCPGAEVDVVLVVPVMTEVDDDIVDDVVEEVQATRQTTVRTVIKIITTLKFFFKITPLNKIDWKSNIFAIIQMLFHKLPEWYSYKYVIISETIFVLIFAVNVL